MGSLENSRAGGMTGRKEKRRGRKRAFGKAGEVKKDFITKQLWKVIWKIAITEYRNDLFSIKLLQL